MVEATRTGGFRWLLSLLAVTDQTALLALLFANTIPLLLMFAFGWDPSGVVIFYWWENLVVGFYSLLRIGLANGPGLGKSKFVLLPFFCFHYFFFCFVHGIFVMILASAMTGDEMGGLSPMGPGLFGLAWDKLPRGGAISVCLLVASHGVSFVRNYLIRGERHRTSPLVEMFRPYGRIVVLHICILAGGFLSVLLGMPAAAAVLLILTKTAIDVVLHCLSHQKNTIESSDTRSKRERENR